MIQFDSDLFDPTIAEEFANEGGGLFGIPWRFAGSSWAAFTTKRASVATTISPLCCSVSRFSS